MIRKLALFALLTAITACAIAQTVSTSISLGWAAPTKNADGSAITGTLTYNLYQGTSGGTFTKAASGITGTTTIVTSTTAGNCFALSTVETIGASSVESTSLSNTTCAVVPGAPSGVTLTLTISVH